MCLYQIMLEQVLSFHLSWIYYWNFFELDKLPKTHRYIVHSVFVLNNVSLFYTIPNEQVIHSQLVLLLLCDVHKWVNELVYCTTYILSICMWQHNENSVFLSLTVLTCAKCMVRNLFFCHKYNEPKMRHVMRFESLVVFTCMWLLCSGSTYSVYYLLLRLVKFSNMANKNANYEWYTVCNWLDELLLPRFAVHSFIQ